jgi:RHS repeat-associated protein
MLEAAKEEIPLPVLWGDSVLPLAADPALLENCIGPKSQLAENSRQGFQLRSSTLRWASSEVKSRTALGMRGTLYDERIRSRCTGKERDAESGLDNFGARYDSSTLGRFMTPDWAARPTTVPYANFGDPQSLNLYGYVRNDPVSQVDADGHFGFNDYSSPVTGIDLFIWGSQVNGDPQKDETQQQESTGKAQNQDCGFFCKLGNWFDGNGFKTDAEVTEDRRQWLINRAQTDAQKDKLKKAPADKVNYLYECLQSPACTAQSKAFIQALAKTAFVLSAQIANGHAWAKHQGEFPGWRQGDFERTIKETIQQPDEMKSLSNGRTAYWNATEKMVVIEDPANVDGGTAFRPTNGKAYFDGLQ